MMLNKIIIAGGSGFIGRHLAQWFAEENEVVILSRQLKHAENNAMNDSSILETNTNIRMVHWDGKSLGEWTKEIEGSSLIINLAGKSVNCRYTQKNKQEIFDSRINATKVLGEAIRKAVVSPKLWINAASATIYRHALDGPQNEFTGEVHNDFSVQVCKKWEQTFFEERTPFTRKVAFRMAITLGAGGVMIPYLNMVKFGLGGSQGNGRQMYSWVHITDVCKAVDFVMKNEELEGAFNISSPNPVTNAAFMRELRQATRTSIGLPAYKWMLTIGAALIGTETELILKSRWVVPSRLLKAGFEFEYPVLYEAFQNIIHQLPSKKFQLF